MTPEIGRSLGTISSWLADKATSLSYGLIQVEVVIQDGRVCRVDKVVKEQIKVER